jgi:hypothetical protein
MPHRKMADNCHFLPFPAFFGRCSGPLAAFFTPLSKKNDRVNLLLAVRGFIQA